MGDQIPFPMNADRYIQLGSECLKNNQKHEAIENFEKAYSIQEDFKVNELLVQCLIEVGQYKKAKQIADEMREDYFLTSDSVKRYITVLLGNHDYVYARKLLFSLKLKQTDYLLLEQEVARAEKYAEDFYYSEKEEIKEQFSTILTDTFLVQSSKVKMMEKLPQKDYSELAQTLLIEKNIPPLLKSTILENLIYYKQDKKVSILHGEFGLKEVELKRVPPIQKQMSYLNSLGNLQEMLSNYDTEIQRQLKQELFLQFSLMYPFADDIVSNSTVWTEVFVSSYLGEDWHIEGTQEKEYEEYQEMQEKLKRELRKMTEDLIG